MWFWEIAPAEGLKLKRTPNRVWMPWGRRWCKRQTMSCRGPESRSNFQKAYAYTRTTPYSQQYMPAARCPKTLRRRSAYAWMAIQEARIRIHIGPPDGCERIDTALGRSGQAHPSIAQRIPYILGTGYENQRQNDADKSTHPGPIEANATGGPLPADRAFSVAWSDRLHFIRNGHASNPGRFIWAYRRHRAGAAHQRGGRKNPGAPKRHTCFRSSR